MKTFKQFTLTALAAAALAGAAAGPAWAAALVVLGYRWFQARRIVPAEAYDTGWAQEDYQEPEEYAEPSPGRPVAEEVQSTGKSGEHRLR